MSVFDEMVKFLDSSWAARELIVPCLNGPVGIGKTAAVHQHAKNVGANKVVTIIASQILPNEVSGITMPVAETKAMEIFDHYRLSSLEDGDILFFDELLEADQMVLSACLTLIESRELMSGRKLPNVQIVAATNPTIKPNMLKESIRQRFVFRRFSFSANDCRKYIEQKYGFDVGKDVAAMVTCSGEEYNILTPRSLTKMAGWISSVADDDLGETARQIDKIWNSSLGTELEHQLLKARSNPVLQTRNAVANTLDHLNIDAPEIREMMYHDFTESSIADLMKLLEELPEWESIAHELSNIEIDEPEESNEVVEF